MINRPFDRRPDGCLKYVEPYGLFVDHCWKKVAAFPVSLIESPKLKIASYGRKLAFEITFPRRLHAMMMVKIMIIFIIVL